jgi:hypothetical protein
MPIKEGENMFPRRIFLIFFIILIANTATFAGIFGPANYEECLLDKMKGQNSNMIYTARTACQKAFPDEPTENVIPSDGVKYTWCKSESESESVCIVQVIPKVKITKIEGVFFEEVCESKQQPKPGVTAVAEKPWYGTTFTFKLPLGARKCAYFTFYGIAN